VEDLPRHRLVGYIPEMIFDKELDYLGQLGVARPALASNSVAVQLRLAAAGAGLAIVHDFALPAAPGLVRVLPEVALERAFFLIRHEDDLKARRLTRFAERLVAGMRRALAGGTGATPASLTAGAGAEDG
jgi:DNA-binding transcriptional LysR family regulator